MRHGIDPLRTESDGQAGYDRSWRESRPALSGGAPSIGTRLRWRTERRSEPEPLDIDAKLAALEALVDLMSEANQRVLDVRLLVEPEPLSGARNMAVDEALLESVAAGGVATLRLYRWSEATVSLGYFQRETPEIEPGGRFEGLPAVRRLSGGGAILHHRELTYSCCIPAQHPLAAEPTRLYDELHAGICAAFQEWGLAVAPRGVTEGDEKPFLCFARGDRRDLVYDGFKVVGSAQRRRRGAILQHGSIHLRRSPFLPEIPGLLDLAQTEINEREFCSRLVLHCTRRLEGRGRNSELSETEIQLAQELEAQKYSPEALRAVKPARPE